MTPIMLPQLQMSGVPRPALWYRADYRNYEDAEGTIPATNGSPVGRLVDVTGTGSFMRQSELTRRPTWSENALDGYPSLKGDGIDDRLTFSLPGGNKTVLLVGRRTSAPLAMIMCLGQPGSNGSIWFTTSSNVGFRYQVGATSNQYDMPHLVEPGEFALYLLVLESGQPPVVYTNGQKQTGPVSVTAWPAVSAAIWSTVTTLQYFSDYEFIEPLIAYPYAMGVRQIVKTHKYYQQKYPSLNIQMPES